jgi:heme exporter protein A
LRGANLQLKRGEVLALYGSNGAGKTTLLKIMATALSPSRGTGTILGFALNDQQRIRGKVLLVSHALGLYQELSGLENLEFSAKMSLKNIPKATLQTALERVGMGNVAARVRAYSSGMRKRLALAKMLILEPELVLLDEPFAALDPEGKNLVEELLILERQRGTTLVIASHEPERTAKISSLETTLQDGLLSEPTAPRIA